MLDESRSVFFRVHFVFWWLTCKFIALFASGLAGDLAVSIFLWGRKLTLAP